MERDLTISAILDEIGPLCPSGYAIALHVRFSTPTFLFQTYDKAWLEHYSRKALVLQDPTVAWGFQNTGRCRWEDLESLDTNGVIAAARAHGIAHGFTLAMLEEGSRSLASFTRPDRPHTEDEMDRIAGLLAELHRKTRATESLPEAERAALRDMSVTLTHG